MSPPVQPTVCPKCKAILQDDYGMVTCPKCDSILFIDLDGVAHMGNEEAPAPSHNSEESNSDSSPDAPADLPFDPPKFDDDWAAIAEAPSAQANEFSPVEISFDDPFAKQFESHSESATQNESGDYLSSAPSFNPSSDSLDEPALGPDYFQSNEDLAQPSYEPAQHPPAEAAAAPEYAAAGEEEVEFSMESFMGGHVESSESGDGNSGHGAASSSQFSNPDDPLDLNDFANSEISQAKDGHLLFRVFITGIDSKEIRDSLREAITDQRFAWDAVRIMANISKGKLKFDQMPPVKAVILINRIKRLPIQIRWEQYEITQSDEP